jgi:hypothetical protein
VILDDPKRLGGAPAAMQRQRILTGGTLSQSVLGGEHCEFTGDLGVTAERQGGFPPLLQRLQPVERQPLDLSPCPIEILQLPEGLSAPQTKGFVQQALGREGVAALPGRPGLSAEETEPGVLDRLLGN